MGKLLKVFIYERKNETFFLGYLTFCFSLSQSLKTLQVVALQLVKIIRSEMETREALFAITVLLQK